MLRKVQAALLMTAVLLITGGTVFAQQAEITVGEISMPSLRWGTQTANFTVTNHTDYPKVISVTTDVTFEGAYMNPVRHRRSNYELNPGVDQQIKQPVDIPGNYGKATIVVSVYDVVDTMDQVLPYQVVASQPFSIQYHIPENLEAYFQEPITLPPLVNNSVDFDSEFSRLLFLLMNEGKTVQQIAEMTQCDTSFVLEEQVYMLRAGYLLNDKDGFKLRFPVITTKEAEEVRPIAEEIADELANRIEANMGSYKATMDSMVAAGSLPPNADDFMNGGSVLYYRYPALTGLFLWYYLGQEFIDPTRPLSIFDRTDYCNARNPEFMYAVQGGPYYNGTNFYDFSTMSGHILITYSDSIPQVDCEYNVDLLHRTLMQNIDWKWRNDVVPEPFVVDTATVRAAFQGLMPGIAHILQKGFNEYKVVFDRYGHTNFTRGARYWFWNLVTSRAIVKLTDKGILSGRGSGFYLYEEVHLQ